MDNAPFLSNALQRIPAGIHSMIPLLRVSSYHHVEAVELGNVLHWHRHPLNRQVSHRIRHATPMGIHRKQQDAHMHRHEDNFYRHDRPQRSAGCCR